MSRTTASNAIRTGTESADSIFPPEILQEIFLQTLPGLSEIHDLQYSSTRSVPTNGKIQEIQSLQFLFPQLVLANVCRRWREDLIASPALWSTIYVDMDSKRRLSLDALEMWINRSKSSPLTMIFYARTARFGILHCQYLQKFFACLDRWKHFFLRLDSSNDGGIRIFRQVNTDKLLDQLSMPPFINPKLLQSTSIHLSQCNDYSQIMYPPLAPLIRINSILLCSQNLRNLEIQQHKHYQTYTLGHILPHPTNFPSSPDVWQHLSRVNVGTIDPHSAIRLLLLSPDVEDVSVDVQDDWSRSASVSASNIDHIPVANLSHLHTLRVSCPSLVGEPMITFLDHLTAPSLKVLELEFRDQNSKPVLAQASRNACLSFLLRSDCRVSDLVLHMTTQARQNGLDGAWELPFLVDEAVCGTLTNITLNRMPAPAIAKLLSATPNVEKLTVELVPFSFPLSPSFAHDRRPFHLPHLREIKVGTYTCPGGDGEPLCIDAIFNAIDAPSLERIHCAHNRPIGHHDQWPAIAFTSLLSRTRHSLSYLYIQWESSQRSIGLLDTLLDVREIHGSLKTLIVWGARGAVTDKTLEYLLANSEGAEGKEDEEEKSSASSQNLPYITLPALRTLILVDVIDQNCIDGLFANTIRSRFENTDLERVCVNFERLPKGAGQIKGVMEQHVLDEKHLLDMAEQGADIHVIRGFDEEVTGWLTGV